MKKVIALCTTFLTGCAPVFFNNGPVDGYSVSQAVSIREVKSESTMFRVYKLNDAHYGLLPKWAASQSVVNAVNEAIIFSPKDLDELRSTCIKIIEAYDHEAGNDALVVEYHLVLNEKRTQLTKSTWAWGDFVSTSGSVTQYNPVIFRLQLIRDVGAFGPRKLISYMYGNLTGDISIANVKALLADLQK